MKKKKNSYSELSLSRQFFFLSLIFIYWFPICYIYKGKVYNIRNRTFIDINNVDIGINNARWLSVSCLKTILQTKMVLVCIEVWNWQPPCNMDSYIHTIYHIFHKALLTITWMSGFWKFKGDNSFILERIRIDTGGRNKMKYLFKMIRYNSVCLRVRARADTHTEKDKQ